MSTNLHWAPAPQPPENGTLPVALKRVIARRLWDHDGTLLGGEIRVDAGLLPYLNGLADAGVEGAADLIAAIEEHGAVLLWIAE